MAPTILERGLPICESRQASLLISDPYGFRIFKQEFPKPWKLLDAKNLCDHFLMFAQFFFQNDFLKFQEVFSKLEITVFPEN
jgi:hypothetical protein